MKTSLSLLVVVGTALVSFTACGTETNGTCEETLSCGGTDGGGDVVIGTDGGGDVVQPPADCDPAAEPKDAPKCVVTGFGVFVDATNGADANAGTKESPVKSITAALTKLGGKARVYVCEGTYAEHVKITSAVSLFGGFACTSWSYSGNKPKIAPTDAGYALEIGSVTQQVVLEDLAMEAAAGTAASRSSIAVFVHQADVKALRISATAHEGHDGLSATTGSNYDAALTADDAKLAGHSASGTVGGTQQDCPALCVNDQHATGGKGGNGTLAPTSGDPGKPTLGAGAGGMIAACNQTLENGNAAPVGDDGAKATALGVLTETGWAPSDGEAGKPGGPGQGGGGGGGAASASNGAGGGGACGGCGGAGGTVAQGGGASIAILALNATLAVTNGALATAKAGGGGAGALGQDGQIGGNGGIQTSGGCSGGNGGRGGGGGASAGGAGGASVGVLFKGAAPTLQATTVAPGTKGAKGAGGKPGTNDGPDGQQGETFQIQ